MDIDMEWLISELQLAAGYAEKHNDFGALKELISFLQRKEK
jgi:hypothetical protein